MKRPDQEFKIVDDTKHRFISETAFKANNDEKIENCSQDSQNIQELKSAHAECQTYFLSRCKKGPAAEGVALKISLP